MSIKKLFSHQARLFLSMLLSLLTTSVVLADEVIFTPETVNGTQSGSTQGPDQMTSGIITVSTTKGQFGRTTDYRIYSGGKLTISANGGFINRVTITPSSGYAPSLLSGDDYVSGLWTGNAESLTLTASAQIRIASIEVQYSIPTSNISTPVISGTTPFDDETTVTISADDGANVYYTLDGKTPSAFSNYYTEPFVITETTTVKAIAFMNGESSNLAEMTFVKNPKFVVESNYPSGSYYDPIEVTFTPKNGTEPYAINYTVTTDDGTTDGSASGPFTLNIDKTTTVSISASDYNGRSFSDTFTYTFSEFTQATNFKLVTRLSDLAPGRQVIIGGIDGHDLYIMGKTGNDNRYGIFAQVEDGTGNFPPTFLNADDNYCTTLIGMDNGQYTFYDINANGFLQAKSSTKNQLGTGDMNDNARATISLDNNNQATITFQGTFTRNMLQFNSQSTNKLFSCYSSTQNKVYLYVESLQSYDIIENMDRNVVRFMSFLVNGEYTDDYLACRGDVVKFNLWVDSDYILDDIVVTTSSNQPVELTLDEEGFYSFTMPEEAITITATTHYGINTLSINPVEHALVKVNDEEVSQIQIKEGAPVTVYIELEEDYSVYTFTVTDTQGNSPEVERLTYSNHVYFHFAMPASDATVNIVTGNTNHEINIVENERGTITVDPQWAHVGQQVTVTVTPNDPTLYEAKKIYVQGLENPEITENTNGVFNFTMPARAVSVRATIDVYKHYVTLNKQNCTVHGLEEAEERLRARGEVVTFSFTPYENCVYVGWMKVQSRTSSTTYEITDNGDGTYSFTMPDEEVMLTLYCTQTVYNVTPNIEHGTVECASTGTVGQPFTFTVHPDEGYAVQNVRLLNESGYDLNIDITNLGNNQYSFIMPDRNVRIYVEMVLASYNIVIGEMEHGTIVPNKTGANHYDDVILNIYPDNGYKLQGITISYNGNTNNLSFNPSTYVSSFVMPAADVVINATFIPVVYKITYNLNGGVAVEDKEESYDITASFNYEKGWINYVTCYAQYNTSGTNETRSFNMYEANDGTWSCTLYGQPVNLYFRADVAYEDEEYDIQLTSYENVPDENGINNGSSSVTMVEDNNTGDTFVAEYTAIFHEATVGNPNNYTVESQDITLVNPTREGYVFTGWTGTGLDQATTTVVIESGSTGDRQYTANWMAQTATGISFSQGETTDTIYTLDGKKINPRSLNGSSLPKGIYIVNGRKVVK